MRKKLSSSKSKEALDIIARAPLASTPRPTVARHGQAKGQQSSLKDSKKPESEKPGKFSSIYLNADDLKLLREFRMWFAGQGVETINNTLIIRSALRAVRMDRELLTAYQEAAKLDRRLKKEETNK